MALTAKASLLCAFLLMLGCINPGEQTISLSDFKNELSSSGSIAIVMDTRSSPSPTTVMQCGANLAQTIGMIGKYNALKNQTFVYENNSCFHTDKNYSIADCESMLNGSVAFYIEYNSEKNSTSFYKSKAVSEGDEGFLEDCAIARTIT